MNPVDLEDFLYLHDARVKQHGVDSAEATLREKRPDDADEIIRAYRERIGEPLRSGRGLISSTTAGWYLPKADADSPRWSYARRNLGLPDSVLEGTARVADEILARLADPNGETIATRGLVLGHVQSGKTTSFLSVAAKAADNDYDLIIILAGVHNSLRRQTQDRATRTLVHKPDLWWLGTAVGDFRPDGNPLSSHLAGAGKRGLLVVKKHSVILGRLADWLEQESDASLRRLSILVIDDEADQAGLDVGQGDELEGVHKQLSRVVNLRTSDDKRRCAYLAYTATPYANILTSQRDFGLYPRDFIYPLDKPTSYVGSEELFGENQVGRPVRIEDATSGDVLTEGLRDAIRWFVLATAARVALGTPLDRFHSSMLVHTTQSTEEQKEYRPAIESYLLALRDEFASDPAVMGAFYERTVEQVPARESGGVGCLAERTAPWADVRPHVGAVLRRLIEREPAGEPFKEDGRMQLAHSGVVVDNSKVDYMERLTYSDLSAGQPSVTIIAVGGNTLSRGLTLEGLVCSYFARTARNYDSLMQMGRWFGYRPGYRHLLRVWTTRDLFDWFQELTQVEQELRAELLWMQENGLTPDRYGPRIRTSPNMNITRAAAMRSVSTEISYSDHVIDPAWLDLEPSVLASNQGLARELARGLGTPQPVGSSLLFRDVPLARVRSFLREFKFHDEEKRVDKPSLDSYMTKEAQHLSKWNVIFKSNSRAGTATFDFGGDVGSIATVTRGRVELASLAYIQSLIDPGDQRLDLGTVTPADGARWRAAGEPPLMVVYAIDPISATTTKSRRVALNAATTPISISLAFPYSNSFVPYVTPAVAEVDTSTDYLDLEELRDD